jgi:hypothetical protein
MKSKSHSSYFDYFFSYCSGGTQLIPNYINQDIWEHVSIQVGNDHIVSVSGDRPNITADIEGGEAPIQLEKCLFCSTLRACTNHLSLYDLTLVLVFEEQDHHQTSSKLMW